MIVSRFHDFGDFTVDDIMFTMAAVYTTAFRTSNSPSHVLKTVNAENLYTYTLDACVTHEYPESVYVQELIDMFNIVNGSHAFSDKLPTGRYYGELWGRVIGHLLIIDKMPLTKVYDYLSRIPLTDDIADYKYSLYYEPIENLYELVKEEIDMFIKDNLV